MASHIHVRDRFRRQAGPLGACHDALASDVMIVLRRHLKFQYNLAVRLICQLGSLDMPLCLPPLFFLRWLALRCRERLAAVTWPLPRMNARNFGAATARLPDVPTTADHARARGAPHRPGGAGALSRPACARRGADRRRQSVCGGAVQPDLSDRGARAEIRPAQEAAGHAAAIGPPGRAGIPHPRRAGRDRRARAACPSPLRGHRHYRHGLLRDGLCGGLGRSGPCLARVCGGSSEGALRLDGRRAGAPA